MVWSSIDSDYFHLMTDPVGWKIDPAAVPAHLDHLFDHLLSIDLKLYLALGDRGGFSPGTSLFVVCRHKASLVLNNYILATK